MTTQAVLFMVGFLAILFAYIYLIAWLARTWGGRIPAARYEVVERVIIAGIVLGVVGMFQPWTQSLYRVGFLLLLFSTLTFIVWSHISPLGMFRDEEDLGPVSISDSISEAVREEITP